ncbi:response regulator [Verrucomicrobiaceae bacterium R5-34]|uniref:Response regulator n=1 Tax=Oceaniferula flava TaxID=2800421 RepID=A0AAE2SAN3_9BACT|nr:response regulator [Oceaniferula flavus]MBK1829123.1 response regulator [Verrucomicrobiaceae bacterium R5-34]MBK1853359.1 response regulator [Oceaniferula flavus]MBM1134664.1 response regulator [Oceaniferula flavus]
MMADPIDMTHRILVVDDEPSLRVGLEMALMGANREIASCGDGYEALAALQHEKFDLIVLDLNMPGLTGLDVLNQMRDRGDMTRVVVCSAHVTERAILSAVRNGVVDFIAKPLSLQELRKFVSDVLEAHNDNPSTVEQAFVHARRLEFGVAAELLEESIQMHVDEPCLENWFRVFSILDSTPVREKHGIALDDARVLADSAVMRS